MIRKVLLSCIVLLLVTVAYAQTPGPTPESTIGIDACDYDTLAVALINIANGFRTADDPRLDLLIWTAVVQTFRVECGGYTFSSEDYPGSVVTDPIFFTDGIYRATLTSSGRATIGSMTLNGNCPIIFMWLTEADSEQEVWNLEGCVAVLTFDSDRTSDWTLTLEKLY